MTGAAHKLPLDAIVARRLLPGLMLEAENNWRDFYHNISLRDFPYEDDELKQWDWYIGDAYLNMKTDITEYLKDEFNEHWEFFQTGRSGATFYPNEPAGGSDYSLNACEPLQAIRDACFDWRNANAAMRDPDEWDLLPPFDIAEHGYDDDDMAELWIHNYEQAKHYRDAFAWINEQVKRHMDYLTPGWSEWKEANDHLFETEEEEAA